MANKAAKQFRLHSTRWYAAAFALRQRMLHFVQNFEYYMMFEVIEPHWRLLQARLAAVRNIDEVLECHMELLENCLKDCMLINQDLIKILTKLMGVCVIFSNFIQRLSHSASVEYREATLTTQGATMQAAQTERQRKLHPQHRKMATKVRCQSRLACQQAFIHSVVTAIVATKALQRLRDPVVIACFS